MAAPEPIRRDLDQTTRGVAALLAPCGGVLGSCGIVMSAAAAHLGGSPLATTGGQFLLLHAAALLGLASLAAWTSLVRYVLAGVLLGIGSVLFCGDLGLAGLYGLHPFPLAAPLGGLLLIAGWLTVPSAALVASLRRGRRVV